MKISLKAIVATAAVAALTLAATGAHALNMTTYSSRTAFLSALTSYSDDDLTGITQYLNEEPIVRFDYIINTGAMYGCVNHAGCGDNSSIGFDGAYLWNYQGSDTFNFAAAVNGFGFNYSNPIGESPIKPIIDGFTGADTAGFFGVIYSQARTAFVVDQLGDYMLIDNITYGANASPASQVPEPSLPALIGISLAGLALARRARQQ